MNSFNQFVYYECVQRIVGYTYNNILIIYMRDVPCIYKYFLYLKTRRMIYGGNYIVWWRITRFEINLINVKSSRTEIVRANKIEENVAMINEIRGAIEAKFYDWTAREWRTVKLILGNSLWWNYTEEGICVIMLKLTYSDESSAFGIH